MVDLRAAEGKSNWRGVRERLPCGARGFDPAAGPLKSSLTTAGIPVSASEPAHEAGVRPCSPWCDSLSPTRESSSAFEAAIKLALDTPASLCDLPETRLLEPAAPGEG